MLQIILKKNEQIPIQSGDTIGYTITKTGNIPFDEDNRHPVQYCRNEKQLTELGSRVALLLDTTAYREYSFQAIYKIQLG